MTVTDCSIRNRTTRVLYPERHVFAKRDISIAGDKPCVS